MKQYQEVLDLAYSLSVSAKAEMADGFQMKDLLPIVTENFQKALAALEGASEIPAEWKADERGCIEATVKFAVSVAFMLLGKTGEELPVEFKETKEILLAIDGITRSIVAALPGGITAAEIFPVITDNFESITLAADGAGKVVEEFKSAPRQFVEAIALFAVSLALSLKDAFGK